MIKNGKFIAEAPVKIGAAYIPAVKWRGDADAELLQRALLRQRQPGRMAGFWRDFAAGMAFWLMLLGPILAYVWVATGE